MYQVLIDGRDLYYPGDEEYVTNNDVLKFQLNDCGTFECNVPFSNPEYNNIKNRISTIQVLKNEKELFFGEVREAEKGFNRCKIIYAVGEMTYLFDTIQPQAKYQNKSVRQMLEAWLTVHNSQVEDKKKFYVGIVTVHDANDSLYRFTNQETTLDAIREKLCDKLGGYLKVRKVNGKRYLDLLTLQDYGKVCEQSIEFGENLQDYVEDTSALDIATACIPKGARLDESEVEGLESYVDIKSVNGGKDYIYIQEAVNRYGWIYKVASFDDVNVPSILKDKGMDWLKDAQYETMVLNLTAVDLSVLDVTIEEFELGDSILVSSEPHGMEKYLPLQALEIHLKSPADDTVKLGTTIKLSYVDQDKENNKGLKDELENNRQTTSWLQSAIDNATQMMTGSKGGYKVTEFDEDGRWLRDLYMNANNKDAATRIMQINMNGIGFSRDGFNGPYNNAWTIDGVLLGEFIKANSIQAQSLSTEYKSSVQTSITDSADGTKEWATSEITTSIKAAEDRINLSVVEQRTYIDGVKETLSGELEVTSAAITAEVKRASDAEGELEGSIKVASDSIVTEVKRAKEEEAKLSASIEVTAESIVNKVSRGDFSSYLEQYYNRVLFKFNTDSKYVQINPGEVGIYDGAISDNKKRSVFDQNGNHFHRDGYYVGKIGTNHWTSNTSHKGLVFDLEYQGKYMAWAHKKNSSAAEYTSLLCYSRANSIYTKEGMHLGTDLYGEWFTLNEMKIGSISAGGYTGFTGAIPIVASITDAGNGVIRWEYSKIRVYNGITAGYWL